MEDNALNFKQALIAQVDDYLMVARLSGGIAIGGGYYKVSDLLAFLNNIQVEDNLTSTNTDTALSANQGRLLNDLIGTKVNSDIVGQPNGLATLDVNGKVPSTQLPGYVDDVLEFSDFISFPAIGESDKIYVDTSTDRIYRWSGSQYIEISSSLVVGETTGSAYDGLKGKENRDAIDSNLAYTESLHADSISKDKDLQAQIETTRKVASTASVETYNGEDIINDTSVSIVGKADDGVIDVSDVVVDGEPNLTLKGKTYTNLVNKDSIYAAYNTLVLSTEQFIIGTNSFKLTVTTTSYSSRIQDNILGIIGHKYFLIGYIYPKYNTPTRLLIGGVSLSTVFPTPNIWNKIMGIVTAETTDIFRFYHATDTQYGIGDSFYCDGLQAIDLTQLGLDTTITTTEQAEDYFTFIDGTSSVLPKKITVNKTVAKVPTDLKSVPSITDTFDVTTGLHTQNTRKYVLTEDDIVSIAVGSVNVDLVDVSSPVDSSWYSVSVDTDLNGALLFPNFTSFGTYLDDVSAIGRVYGASSNRTFLIVAKGTYSDLATAKTALAGTVVYYQLATPVITQYEPQPLLVTKGSQIEVESFESKTVPNSDGIITFDYDIASVEHVYRYDTGEEVETTDYTFVDNILTVNNIVDLIVISVDVYLSNSTNPTLVSKVPVENLNSRVTNNEVITGGITDLEQNVKTSYDGTDALIETDIQQPSDLHLKTGANKTLVLDSVVWDDIRTPITNARAIVGKEATWTPYRGSLVLAFSASQDNAIAFTVQLPHSYKVGSDIEFHIHDVLPTDGSGNVKWDFTYSWANMGEEIPIETTISTTIDTTGKLANYHNFDEIVPVISGIGKDISSMILCSLTRDITVASNYANDVYLMEVDFHFPSDTSGSRHEDAK